MYELIDLNDEDREQLVEMMEMDPIERQRIQTELDRVSSGSTAHFLKTPLMTKNIIQLIISKKVDIAKIKNSSEMYLMFRLA